MMLLGLAVDEAKRMLHERNLACSVIQYDSAKPYDTADSMRVVRAVQAPDGVYHLTVCGFITDITNKESQG